MKFIVSFLLFLTFILVQAEEVNFEIIKQLEEYGDYKVTDKMLEEWNIYNPLQEVSKEQLENPKIKKAIFLWFLNVRTGQILQSYNVQNSLLARLILYHAGIEVFTEGKSIPPKTNEFIQRYKEGLTREKPVPK